MPTPVLGAGKTEHTVTRILPLDGVRALAIIPVLFFHQGFSWLGGGFFGVDIFFVLSGFLITGLLLAEFRESAHIALKKFWARRARRLLPAVLLLLVALSLYAVFLAPPDSLNELRINALSTLVYGNNWNQVSTGQGYFAALTSQNPLIHTWSLSIEEQFYLVWPLIVLGVLKWRRSSRPLLWVAVVGSVASALAMGFLYDGGAGLSRAYYGTDTRAQALLVGAALAVLLSNPIRRAASRHAAARPAPTADIIRSFAPTRWGRGLLVAVGGMGLAVLGWMMTTVTGQSSWPYYGGFFLVALATAAVIASVVLMPTGPWGRVLSWTPLRFVGMISYGLYLWHWPVFVVLDNSRTGLVGWPLFALRVLVSFAVAVLSYYLVERPVRRGALHAWRAWAVTSIAVGGTAAVLAAATAGGLPELAAAGSAKPAVSHLPRDPGTGPNVPVAAANTPGPIRTLLVGDSEASFLGFGLGPEGQQYDVDFTDDGVIGCGLMGGTTRLRGKITPGTLGIRSGSTVPCANQAVRWVADLTTFHPDVVLLADGEFEVRDHLVHGTWMHIGEPTYDRLEMSKLMTAVHVLRSTGAVVLLLTGGYYQQPEQEDGQPWPEDNPQRIDRFNAMLRQVAARYPSGVVVENLNKHLNPSGRYQQTLDGVDLRYEDGIHVTPAGARLVAPWLLSQVHQLGTANRADTPAAPLATPSTPPAAGEPATASAATP
ncbi:MAG TPA: acyltransferase family protein [Acidimicrobiales bacterium]|nr:acyltransferase family protein [Acidimicrobiales bacterium]